ncbi:hypothetical protein AN214_02793 [Pseudoalteromonas sp. P1-9]|uniref:hypothetical protein n=1 Tax=Pseudoalteromonas sp. P1-9 TaxID=1710354 RepID=UPI0006D60348|nr:hypothetical protein [Pseudoalteromonas sp. P1-9]KPV95141.1 hypothetical protein AN214_02793 [Pseudoalteromonas sp. P1-9]
MNPDYSKYNIEELIEVCSSIDREKYPERYESAKTQLALKQQSKFDAVKNSEKHYNNQNRESHRINASSHLKEFLPTSTILVCCFAIWLHFSINKGLGWLGLHSMFALFWLLIALIPQLILHLRYSSVNKNHQIVQDKRLISISSKDLKHVFSWDDIDSVDLYLPTSQYFSGSRIVPSENYSFGIIQVKGMKGKVIITSLLDTELLWLRWLKPSVTKRHWRVISFV